jgi:hypothetical protein
MDEHDVDRKGTYRFKNISQSKSRSCHNMGKMALAIESE